MAKQGLQNFVAGISKMRKIFKNKSTKNWFVVLTLPPLTLIDFVEPNFSRSWPFNRVDRVKEYLRVEWNEYINPLSRNV